MPSWNRSAAKVVEQKIPHMTRRDFEFLAEIIREIETDYIGGEIGRRNIARAFADSLRFTNGGFSRERFIKDCTL